MANLLRSIKIGKITLDNNIILAPMAGVNDLSFRQLCKEAGAGLVTTEMISANALARFNSATIRLARVQSDERPVSTQLFGQNVENLVRSAKILAGDIGDREDTKAIRPDIIDFNLGCPAQKVLRQGAGSALLSRPARVKEILKSLREATDLPLTVKIRSGLTDRKKNYIEIAKICCEFVDMISVHARTQAQGYSGKADWDVIAKIKEAVDVPVVGNGDVFTPEDAKKMLEETGCDGVMVGRAALGNPMVFTQIGDYLKTGKYEKLVRDDRLKSLARYLVLAKQHGIGFSILKKQSLYFLRDFPGSVRLRGSVARCENIDALEKMLFS
ncbi:tRNA dihydrouridine synthase DusB [Candidatus Woesearchaeota archaeon CG08_land_8_20_14_0_20_43_7]|nr:MAG: tRNA dihydrouridine synthase DusB [Candidatus Woesearchaeota archaeon CG08_land_8_20_14_0_20_43_7]